MPQIIGYARVSTDDQDLSGQQRRLEEAGATRIFEDKISGKRFDRPGFSKFLDYAREGDTLVVVRLDRLGRSLRDLLDVVACLKQRGIALRSLEEQIDTGSAAGELVLHVFAALAQFERRLIGERTRDGLVAARARGQHVGRPFADQERVDAALQLIDNGMTAAAAARMVGIGRSTLYREMAARRPAGEGLGLSA